MHGLLEGGRSSLGVSSLGSLNSLNESFNVGAGSDEALVLVEELLVERAEVELLLAGRHVLQIG